MDKSEIFLIHIPKTAGTSVRQILLHHNIEYRELHFNRRMECAPINYLDEILKNPAQKVILTWRNPVDHLWSTFHFYQEYPNFSYPNTFEAFIDHPNLQNQQAAFLMKKNFFDCPIFDDQRVKKIYALIDRPNTLCFLQNYFQASQTRLEKFLSLTSITTNTPTKRFNFNKPQFTSNQILLSKIKSLNSLDLQLYNHMVEKYYCEATPEKSSSLPSYFPVEWPINLVAGKTSLEKYRALSKRIHAEIKCDHIREISTVEDYILLWLKKFSTLVIVDAVTPLKNLDDLKTFLNDTTSEKFTIRTTSF
jgi:hypothetical protein